MITPRDKELLTEWLSMNLQMTSKSNVELIVGHIDRYFQSPTLQGEELYRWVKASERLPEDAGTFLFRLIDNSGSSYTLRVHSKDETKRHFKFVNDINIHEWLEPITVLSNQDEYKKGYRHGWEESRVGVNQDELWKELYSDIGNGQKPEKISSKYIIIKR